jgi:hypothetical protein
VQGPPEPLDGPAAREQYSGLQAGSEVTS